MPSSKRVRPAWTTEATGPRVLAQTSSAAETPPLSSASLTLAMNLRALMSARLSDRIRSKAIARPMMSVISTGHM